MFFRMTGTKAWCEISSPGNQFRLQGRRNDDVTRFINQVFLLKPGIKVVIDLRDIEGVQFDPGKSDHPLSIPTRLLLHQILEDYP